MRIPLPPSPGRLLARGVCRHLLSLDVMTLEEFSPARGLRLDVMGLAGDGNFLAVECKSGVADFRSDRKWRNYLPHADRFYWAVGEDFPLELLPGETGIIIADSHGAEIRREAPGCRMNPARRRALLCRFGRHAARAAHGARDPWAMRGSDFQRRFLPLG